MIPTSTRASVKTQAAIPANAEAVAIFLTEGAKADAVGEALGEGDRRAVERLIAAGAARGKAREVAVDLVENGRGHRRLIVVGLGPADKVGPETIREAAGAVIKSAQGQRVSRIAVVPPASLALSPADIAEALATGTVLASFVYAEYHGTVKDKANTERPRRFDVSLIISGGADVRQAVERATTIAESQNFARTIASRPGNDINPPSLAKVAQDMARQVGLTARVMDEKEMKKLGMGGITAVGAGSNATPPRMIVLEYRPKSAARDTQPLLVVGKAVTFDTGGISIKPADKMGRMVFDKCGGMAVLGLMHAVARLKPAIPVIGILGGAENQISETAYRPGDILRMYNGVTVEVTNTDAEGRLVLGDALAWGIETYQPAAVVDLATLTGGCIVALGHSTTGLMANDDALADEIRQSAEAVGEKVWRLPLTDEAREMLKSQPADITNSAGRWASALQGGVFLSHFIAEGTPWVHLDIAGTAETEKDLPYYAPGATGWGVRTLVQWVLHRAESGSRGDRGSATASVARARRTRTVDSRAKGKRRAS